MFILALAALISLRFAWLFSYPGDVNYDEFFNVHAGFLRHSGGAPFFSMGPGLTLGSGGCLLNTLGAFFVPLFREHLTWYRLIPALAGLAFMGGLFLLVRDLFNGRAARWAVLLAACSFWNYYTSRFYVDNSLIPALTVFSLYFLNKALSRGWAWLAPFLLCYLAGFYTYIAIFLSVPLFLYLAYLRRKQGQIGAGMFLACVVLILGVAVAAAWHIDSSSGMFVNALSVLRHPGENGVSADFWHYPANLRYLFLPNPGLRGQFPANIALMNPVEAALLGLGLVLAFLGRENPRHRLVLAMFALFLLPLVTTVVPHPFRFMQLQVPVFVLMALALDSLSARKNWLAVAGLALVAAGFGFSLRAAYLNFRDQPEEKIFTNMAQYLNAKFGPDTRYLQNLDFWEKERMALELKATYSPGKPGLVSARFDASWLDTLRRGLPLDREADLAVFQSTVEGRYKMYPFLLVTCPCDSKAGRALAQIDARLEKTRYLVSHAEGLQDKLAKLRPDRSAWTGSRIYNTLLKSMQADLFLGAGDPCAAARAYTRRGPLNFTPPDFLHKAAKARVLCQKLGPAKIP